MIKKVRGSLKISHVGILEYKNQLELCRSPNNDVKSEIFARFSRCFLRCQTRNAFSIQTYMHAHTQTDTHTHTHLYIYIRIYPHTHTHAHSHAHTHILKVCMHMGAVSANGMELLVVNNCRQKIIF